MRLKDKVALITSAAHPCASAIAAGFAREGADCAIVESQLTKAEQLAAEIRALRRRTLGLEVAVPAKSQVHEGGGLGDRRDPESSSRRGRASCHCRVRPPRHFAQLLGGHARERLSQLFRGI